MQLVELIARRADERPRLGIFLLGGAPRVHWIAAVETAGGLAEFLLRRLKLAGGDSQQPIDRKRDALVKSELLLETLLAEAEGAFRLRPNFVLELVDVSANRVDGFAAGVSEDRKSVV